MNKLVLAFIVSIGLFFFFLIIRSRRAGFYNKNFFLRVDRNYYTKLAKFLSNGELIKAKEHAGRNQLNIIDEIILVSGLNYLKDEITLTVLCLMSEAQVSLMFAEETYNSSIKNDFGLDSLDSVHFIMTLEKVLKIKIEDSDAESFKKLSDVINFLKKVN